MGRIITQVKIENLLHDGKPLEFSAMVDTGAMYLTLPSAWRNQLGETWGDEKVELQTATQETVEGRLCGPFKVSIARFRPIYVEVLFIDMQPDEENDYEPLLGYLPLEACSAAVDMLGHRLVPVKYIDLK